MEIKRLVEVTPAKMYQTDRDLNITVVTVFDENSKQGITIGIKNEHIDTLIAKLIEYKKDNNL